MNILNSDSQPLSILRSPLQLPCGAILKNRIAKSAMSDSLADGEGNPTEAQIRLYERWTQGGAAVSFIGEVQCDFRFPEKPGNLVFDAFSDRQLLKVLVKRAVTDGAHLWPQIGHAGALSHLSISHPAGPSPLDVEDLHCVGMSIDDIRELPEKYAGAASLAQETGFTGVHVHAGHGFLLSQFLSPLFNRRSDGYGGTVAARCRIILEIISAVRRTVGASFPIGIRINATDLLEGGLTELDALEVVRLLDQSSIDLIDISGGTYFPGAKSSSEENRQGPYFIDFARAAKKITRIPLMLTGGFKQRSQALEALASGTVDIIGLARAMVLDSATAHNWLSDGGGDPVFPRFESSIPGGITAWYTMRLTALGEDREHAFELGLMSALRAYEQRDLRRCVTWKKKFSLP